MPLDQLKAKYQSVIDTVNSVNGSMKNLNMEGDKLFIRAEVPNDDLKNKVWNQIKAVDPGYSDLTADIQVNSSLTPPAAAAAAKTYTLGKISQQFYGKAGEYMKIFNANTDKLSDPDKIQVGQVLVIPD
jgi:LysM repeat protein